jgi:hypothetical protein
MRVYSDSADGATFLAWFPLNNELKSHVRNNFGMRSKESEDFCITLISLLGLKSLATGESAAA